MKIALNELRTALERAWQSATDKESAQYIADKVLSTHLRKDDRINAISKCIEDLEKYHKLDGANIGLVSSSAGYKVYDLHQVPGLVYLKRINDELVQMARDCGIASIGIRNTGGLHTLDTWVLGLAEQDCIGLAMWNGGPYAVTAYGSREASFGTNPLAYAIPTNKYPIIADMATSEIPFMDLTNALERKRKLPNGVGLDSKGKQTTDPKKIFVAPDSARLLPMGGSYKGGAIVLLVEILTGALIGAKMGREASNVFKAEEFGGLLLCINVGSFTSLATFKSSVTKMGEQIRISKPAHGFKAVMLPGDKGHSREEQKLKSGVIELEKSLIVRMHELAKKTTRPIT